MITIENRTGRLIEVRFASPLTDAELTDFVRERESLMRAVGRDRIVCIDLSRVKLLSPEQADFFVEFLRGSRPGLTRNAFLIPPGQAVLALQFARILREGNNPARRAFQSRSDLTAWLSEVLRPDERARLEAFLDAEETIGAETHRNKNKQR